MLLRSESFELRLTVADILDLLIHASKIPVDAEDVKVDIVELDDVPTVQARGPLVALSQRQELEPAPPNITRRIELAALGNALAFTWRVGPEVVPESDAP